MSTATRISRIERQIGSTAKPSGDIDVLSSPAKFRQFVLVETSTGPRLLEDALDDWQRADFVELDQAWMKVAAIKSGSTTKNRCYLERPRGHSKTSDLAVMVAWALAAARKPIAGVAAAADRDQGRLLRDAVARLVRLNPWLADHLDVQAHRIVGKQTGATLEIISSDAPSSYGLTPSFVVADELTHWPENAGGALWDSLFSSSAKVSDCLLVVISNAGCDLECWQWRVREHARTDADWLFSRVDGPRASWLSPKVLAEQRRLLPEPVFARLWLNEWQSHGGNAISKRDLEAALVLDGIPSTYEPGAVFYAGLDLGLARDTTALVVIERKATGNRVKLVEVMEWIPQPGQRVSIEEVERSILDIHQRLGIAHIAVDPWQAAQLCERLRTAGMSVGEITATGSNLQQMADVTLAHFTENTISLWDHPGLTADLRALRIIEKGNGWRLDGPRDRRGHCDRATALSLALLAARERRQSGGVMMFDRSDIPSLASFFSQAEREHLGMGAN